MSSVGGGAGASSRWFGGIARKKRGMKGGGEADGKLGARNAGREKEVREKKSISQLLKLYYRAGPVN